jgi:hypothetical protein
MLLCHNGIFSIVRLLELYIRLLVNSVQILMQRIEKRVE